MVPHGDSDSGGTAESLAEMMKMTIGTLAFHLLNDDSKRDKQTFTLQKKT